MSREPTGAGLGRTGAGAMRSYELDWLRVLTGCLFGILLSVLVPKKEIHKVSFRNCLPILPFSPNRSYRHRVLCCADPYGCLTKISHHLHYHYFN